MTKGVYLGIRPTVVTVFVLATCLTAAVAIGLQYYFGQALAKEAAQDLYEQASASVAKDLGHINDRATDAIELLADHPSLGRDVGDKQLRLFVKVLEQNPVFYGVYVGRPDGSFFEVVNLRSSEATRKSLLATPMDRWLVITVRGAEGDKRRTFRYLDESFKVRATRHESTRFDVTSRPWYQSAQRSDAVQYTTPYLFSQLQVPGQTISKRVQGDQAVIGIDVLLSSLSTFLQQKSYMGGQGHSFIYEADGQLLASSDAEGDLRQSIPVPPLVLTAEETAYVASLPELKVSNELNWPPFDYAIAGQPRGYSIEVMELVAQMTGLKLRFVNGSDWTSLVNQFKQGELDILHSVILTDDNRDWGLATNRYAVLPYALAYRQNSPPISGLDAMAGMSLAIPKGWSVISVIRERFPAIKIVEADSTLDAMNRVIQGRVDAALDNQIILQYIEKHYFFNGLRYQTGLDFGPGGVPDQLHAFVRADEPQLAALINKALAALGPLQRHMLAKKWLTFSREAVEGGSGVVPHDAFIDIAASEREQGVLQPIRIGDVSYFAYAVPLATDQMRKRYFGVLIQRDLVFAGFLKQVMISIVITGGFLLLILPLSWLCASPIVTPIKQLALENDKIRRREHKQVLRVPSNIKEIDQLSESMVDMVHAIQAHEKAQQELMDSFIKLIAQAIDDKSPYTGGHCARVPELALMLAHAAAEAEQGPFAQFAFQSDDEWREYRIAAWLHDCGKITTPEHVVDKGTKLETIYNRIHEVRMRFEVLWRDAHIDYLRACQERPENQVALGKALTQRRQQLQDDFAFVAECNVGGEFLDDDKIRRLEALACTTWTRHFDDRLGISPVEELRYADVPKTLPVEEHLLRDCPEHIIPRTQSTEYPEKFGINMDIPEHLYNLGELHNLSISRGTLTAEDRFKINEHMISTIKMLEALPFPDELKRVPRYASTHHETVAGTGYPRRLSGDELSIPERFLVVADIFEALTASDRPYKKAKTVSESIKIMLFMVKDQHIDPACFEFFLSSGVYLDYAKQYLKPEQIDEVDLSQYL